MPWSPLTRPTAISVGMPRGPVVKPIVLLVTSLVIPTTVIIWVRATRVIIVATPAIIVPCRPSIFNIPPRRGRPGGPTIVEVATFGGRTGAFASRSTVIPSIAIVPGVAVVSGRAILSGETVFSSVAIITTVAVIATFITTRISSIIVGTSTLHVELRDITEKCNHLTHLRVHDHTNRLPAQVLAVELLHGPLGIIAREILENTEIFFNQYEIGLTVCNTYPSPGASRSISA